MEEKQIYVSFEPEDYKLNKRELLLCKANLISIQKNLHHLSAIRSAKKRLIQELIKKVGSASYVISKLDEKMPDGNFPKLIIDKVKKKEVKKISKENIDVDFEVGELDKELQDIQSKLKELNK